MKTQRLMFGFPAGVGTGPDDIRQYDPSRIDRQLTLDTVEDWVLTSKTSRHILDHEDTGMMQNVRIVLPDGQGGQAPATPDAMTHGGRAQQP